MGMGASRSRGLVVLAGVSFTLSLGLSVAGVVVLSVSSAASGTSFEIGRWLLQLGVVLAGTGFLTAVLRQVEMSRAKRDAWTTMLQDLVVAQDAVEGAFMRLTSNATAETYAQLIERCRELRSMLRRVIALPEVYNATDGLRQQVQRIRFYLKPLIQEYEQHYLQVARQGLLDEKVLTARLDAVATGTDPTATATLPAELSRPSGVGDLLADPAQFPALAACLKDFEPREGEFAESSEMDMAYESVKAIVRSHAGALPPGP